MERAFKNENTGDVFMNEVKMKVKPLQELEKIAIIQTKGSRNPKNNKEKMNYFWKSYMHKDYFGN
jgi:hypothetical protein